MTENALLLLNLGSPDSTRVEDVRRYLDQFLMDPLRGRPTPAAAAPAGVADPDQASGRIGARLQLDLVGRRVATDRPQSSPAGSDEAALAAWTGGTGDALRPAGAIEKVLLDLARRGIRRVTLAPLHPQFADSTTTTAEQEVRRVIAAHRLGLEVSTLPPFYDQPVYLMPPVESVRPYLQQPHDHLLLSFPRLARAAHPQAGEGSCPRPAGREQPQRQPRSPRPLLPQPVPAHRREAFAERAGLEQGRWSVSNPGRAWGAPSGSSPIPTPSSTNWCSVG